MRCFIWADGKLSEGIGTSNDDRLGPVVFLGEDGRGRRYEKVALGRKNPAEVVNGRVLDAHPVKITLPAKDGKPEKAFYVLEKPRNGGDEVLVRVYTYTAYIRGGSGGWRVVAGKPETLIKGFGAFGDAGRVGGWDDGLVVMRPGDVLKVYPSRGTEHALWLDNGKPVTATWRDFENIQAVAKAQQVVEKASEKPDALEVIFGQMRAFTFAGGQITKGLRVQYGATGPVIAFGETGRGRSLVEVPLVGIETVRQGDPGRECTMVEVASVVKLDEKVTPAQWYGDKPTVKTIYGLTSGTKPEDAFLVRVSTAGPYTKGTTGEVIPWKGNPTVITTGSGAHGDAGRVGGWDDALLVMHEGDVLFVRSEGGYKSEGPWAVFMKNGELKVEFWQQWKLQDAKSDPDFYVTKGTAPMGRVPSEWVGRIVTVCYLSQGQSGCGPEKTYLEERATGELVRIGQDNVVLNLGWDGKDYHETSINGQWVRLEKDKNVRKPEGEAAEKRKLIRAQVELIRDMAVAAMKQSYFDLASSDMRCQMEDIASSSGFEAMPTEGWCDSLASWVEKAKVVVERFAALEPELQSLEWRKKSGEVLVNWGGYFRRMGATNNADYWVIRSDGSRRGPDEQVGRRRWESSEGTKSWRVVGAEELAISFAKSCTADNFHCKVDKLPVGGCTPTQIEAVATVEAEIGVPRGWFGLDPERNRLFVERLAAAKKLFARLPAKLQGYSREWLGEWTFPELAGHSGVHVAEDPDVDRYGIVHSAKCSDGVLELWVYEKFGHSQLNMRWRELTEEEKATSTAMPIAKAEAPVIDAAPATPEAVADGLAALRAKFGGKK